MNSVDIERFLRDRVRNFDGVFSVDALSCMPRLLVCNTDPSYMPGRHWICVYVKDGRGEYFDSFGRRPNSVFERYLNRHCSSWIFNDRQLQSVASKFCGHYCVLRDRGINMRKFISSFTSDTGLNDVLVHASVYRRLRSEFSFTNRCITKPKKKQKRYRCIWINRIIL